MPEPIVRILFVCMGNICRSPAAEAVFIQRLEDSGIAERFQIESAGTGGWHAGDQADPRSRAEGDRRGFRLDTPARQIEAILFLVAHVDRGSKSGIDLWSGPLM